MCPSRIPRYKFPVSTRAPVCHARRPHTHSILISGVQIVESVAQKRADLKKSGKTDVKGRSHPTSNRLRCFVSYTLFFAPPPLFEHLEQEIYGQAFQIFKTYHEFFVKCVTKGFAHSIIHQRKGSHEKL